jgi:4-hydroxy-tetrahydrodipicolinate synthase
VLYNVPGRTSCDLLPETVARLAEIDRIVAIKEASDVRRAGDLVALCGDRVTVLSGDDATALPIIALGGRGLISVASNAAPARVAELCAAAMAGDNERARAVHYDLLPLFRLLFVEPNPAPVKAALELMGRIEDGIRLPLAPCTPQLRERLAECMKAKGLL